MAASRGAKAPDDGRTNIVPAMPVIDLAMAANTKIGIANDEILPSKASADPCSAQPSDNAYPGSLFVGRTRMLVRWWPKMDETYFIQVEENAQLWPTEMA